MQSVQREYQVFGVGGLGADSMGVGTDMVLYSAMRKVHLVGTIRVPG